MPQFERNGISVVYGNVAVSKPGTVGMITGGTSSISSIATSGVKLRHQRAKGIDVRNRPEHHLGFGLERNHVRRHAAFDETDGVMRAAQHRVIGQFHLAHHQQRVDELFDRRYAELRE